MKVTFNLRSGVGPITLDLPGQDDAIVANIKSAIDSESTLELTDDRGDRVLIPTDAIGYVLFPTTQPHRVGFGRA